MFLFSANAGIPGCGKSAVCMELLRNPGALSDGRTLHMLMGDLVKGMHVFMFNEKSVM